MSIKSKRQCEVCSTEIPDDFGNDLCLDCYGKDVKEQERKKKIDAEEKDMQEKEAPQPPAETVEVEPEVVVDLTKAVNGITQEGYTENPMKEDKDQVLSNFNQFVHTYNKDKGQARMIWHDTRNMYEFIKNQSIDKVLNHPQYPKFIWRPKVVDVGCGSGVGTNILSQEADFTWGIDKNKMSIDFAKDCFTRNKNGIYYSAEVKFDQLDIVEDTRELMQFDVVVAIEIIEHIDDYKTFMENIIRKFTKRDKSGNYNAKVPTEFYISTPNRNNKKISDKQPGNKFHVREWNSQEFVAVLSDYFNNVQLFSVKGEEVPVETTHTPIVAKCWGAKI